MTDISAEKLEKQANEALFTFLALGGFWVMVAAIAWMSI